MHKERENLVFIPSVELVEGLAVSFLEATHQILVFFSYRYQKEPSVEIMPEKTGWYLKVPSRPLLIAERILLRNGIKCPKTNNNSEFKDAVAIAKSLFFKHLLLGEDA